MAETMRCIARNDMLEVIFIKIHHQFFVVVSTLFECDIFGFCHSVHYYFLERSTIE